MRARLLIDLDAIVANWRQLAAHAMGAKTAAVVKADAYGLGVGPIAQALLRAGCRILFVARLDEGIELRSLAPQAQIYVLDGVGPGEAQTLAAHDLIPVLNHRGQIERWREEARRRGRPLPAALHVDTGMTRLGLPPNALLAGRGPELDGLEPVLLMSHLACADEPQHPLNHHQLERFRALLRHFPGIPASLAASSGIFLGPKWHFDVVRPGAALYGVNPTPGRTNPMRPVVTLRAPIVQLHEIREPSTIGYGATRALTPGMRVATVAAGYADGILRAASDRAVARLGHYELPYLGRVSMDLLSIDVTALPPHLIHEGVEVELIGGPDGIDRLAAAAGTIGYEVLTRLGRRAERCYQALEAGH
jgi:alanine racemase